MLLEVTYLQSPGNRGSRAIKVAVALWVLSLGADADLSSASRVPEPWR